MQSSGFKFFLLLFLSLPLTAQEAVDYSIEHQNLIVPMIETVDTLRIESDIRWISSFKTRFYKSQEAVDFHNQLGSKWKRLAEKRNDVRLEHFYHVFPARFRPNPQEPSMPSLIFTIKGSEFPEEIIIIGGHGDSLAFNVTTHKLDLAPGADDNASGIAVITEIIRVLMSHNYRPKRTLMFMSYSAEEIGLIGSREIASSFKDRKILGVLNLDMVNYQGASGLDFTIMSDYTDLQQNKFLEELAKIYLPNATWEYTACGRRCSDHASWNTLGFRVSMLTESKIGEHNPHIHTTEDTIDKSNGNADHAVDFAKMGLAFLVELDR